MLDLINLKLVSLKLDFVRWPAEVMCRRSLSDLSVSFTCALSSQITAGGEKEVGNSEGGKGGRILVF